MKKAYLILVLMAIYSSSVRAEDSSISFKSIATMSNSQYTSLIKGTYADVYKEVAKLNDTLGEDGTSMNAHIDLLVAEVDLNQDGHNEYFVYLQSSAHCGNYGCGCQIYAADKNSLKEISGDNFWCIVNNDFHNIVLLQTRTSTYQDILLDGISNGQKLRRYFRWNGTHYEQTESD